MALTPSTMLPLGTTAPGFSLRDTDGQTVSLHDFAGSPALVVAFICNHCPFVKHIREGLASFGNDMRAAGVAVVAISSNDITTHPADSPENMAKEKASAGYDFPYLFDTDQSVAAAYHAACTPDFFVFDRNQKLAYRGQFDDSRPGNGLPVTGTDIRNAVADILAGRSPSAVQKPSIGCNIKWSPGRTGLYPLTITSIFKYPRLINNDSSKQKIMSKKSFGSGLDEDQPADLAGETSASPAQPEIQAAQAPVNQEPAETVTHVEESRAPFILAFHESIKGLPLELGPNACATVVYAGSREWLLSTDQEGLLHLASVNSGDQPVVEAPCPLFESHRWAAFDARTCDQTGNVIWLGICRTSGDLYVSVEINDAFTGKRIEPLKIGTAADLSLPANPGRIKSMQLTDWFGRGRLEALLHLTPEREPGGTSLYLLERRGDSILQGYLPLQLADSDADRLLAGGAGNRLVHVAWAGSGSDQLLHLDDKGNLNLLTNFGGALPPGVGKPRHVTRASGTPAVIAGGISSLKWVKHYAAHPGRLIIVSLTGHVSIADAGSVSTLSEPRQFVSRGVSELVFGPDAVVTATDWDNDGGLDIVVGDSQGGLTLYNDRGKPGSPAMGSPDRLESGGLTFVVPNRDSRRHSNMDPGPPRYSCPVLNDWTAHQRFDVLVTDARGAVWYMRNNGAKTQPRLDFADRVSCEGKPMFVAPRSQLAVAHWNGGTEPDVIGFDSEGHLACWPRKDKMELGAPEKLTDVRKRPISLGGRGRRAGLVHLWAGAWTVPGSVEIIVSVPKFAVGRLADWLEITIDKPLEEFPLFWLLQKHEDGLTARPLRTKNAELIHSRMPDHARSYSVSGVILGGRKLPDLLVVPEKGKAMIWPRETLRWD